jgi:hypothetical protein
MLRESRQVMEAFSSLSSDQIAFLRAISRTPARYLVVGGYAVRHHKCFRHTEDLDIFLERSESSVDALLLALSSLDTGDVSKVREHLLREEKKIVWNGVDLFTTMRQLEFQNLFDERVQVPYSDICISVISRHHLKLAKQIAIDDPERSSHCHIDREDLKCLKRHDDNVD